MRWYLAVAVTVAVVWCGIYGKTNLAAWQTPLSYSSDSWFFLGVARAFQLGELHLAWPKSVVRLGAPGHANWNDWPMTEEFPLAAMGWLARGIGLIEASNLVCLALFVLAGLSFYAVSRAQGTLPGLAYAGAVLFGTSHFLFYRSLGHLNVTCCFQVPLMLLVVGWSLEGPLSRVRLRRAAAISLLSGSLNPYYSFMYIQLLVFSALTWALRRGFREVLVTALLIGLTGASFLVMNLDTLTYRASHGFNPNAVVRDLRGLEVYGLRLPDLFTPPPYHRWTAYADWMRVHYLDRLTFGERGGAYLGLVGLTGLGWLALSSGRTLLLQGAALIPAAAGQIAWILAFSVVGGGNLVLGTFGVTLFRATNRFSIFILCLALLWLVRKLSEICPPRRVGLLVLALLAVGLWDQTPSPDQPQGIAHLRGLVERDRALVQTLEAALPPGSAVFELPVMQFPESPPIHELLDYAPLRPFLYARRLRFSYGTNRGRHQEDWQKEVAEGEPLALVQLLESLKFEAVLIFTAGYPDQGEGLISAFGRPVLARSSDLVALRLNPAEVPLRWEFSRGWSDDELSHRWARERRASLELWLDGSAAPWSVSFRLQALRVGRVRIVHRGATLQEVAVAPGETAVAGPFRLHLEKGRNVLDLEADFEPASPAGNPEDTRQLTFQVSGWTAVPGP